MVLNNFLLLSSITEVLIYSKKPKATLKEIRKHFQYIKAAGAVVSKKNQILLIKRFGMWDLPKGKVEPKESAKKAAYRELFEETNCKCKIGTEICTTYHIYPFKKGFVLKQTKWFEARAKTSKQLKAQKKEGIEKVMFKPKKKALELLVDSYMSFKKIKDEINVHKKR